MMLYDLYKLCQKKLCSFGQGLFGYLFSECLPLGAKSIAVRSLGHMENPSVGYSVDSPS